MGNIIDYVLWRGDLSLERIPLSEVDALILSYLSYMPFESMVPEAFDPQGVKLADAAAYLLEKGLSGTCVIDNSKPDGELLKAIMGSARFGQIRATGYVCRFDEEAAEQFSAVTFLLPDAVVVAFRGTDASIAGWREDFNMSFSGEVPSQAAALEYLVKASRASHLPVTIVGHSKGGNLAIYAGVFAPEAVQQRIAKIYNFDGPGFNEKIVTTEQTSGMNLCLHSYVPQTSLVGILMWHAESPTVVRSDGVGILQHNPYAWQVMGGGFVTAPERTRESKLAEETLRNWLSSLTIEERKRLVDGVFDVLSVSDGRDLSDLFEPDNLLAILHAVRTMEEETKDVLMDALKHLGMSFKAELPQWWMQTTEQFKQRAPVPDSAGG